MNATQTPFISGGGLSNPSKLSFYPRKIALQFLGIPQTRLNVETLGRFLASCLKYVENGDSFWPTNPIRHKPNRNLQSSTMDFRKADTPLKSPHGPVSGPSVRWLAKCGT